MEAAVRTIRQLQPVELPLILDMAHSFFEESNHPGTFDDDTFVLSWTSFMKSGTGVIFIMTEAEKILGAIGGLTYRNINTGKPTALETFWYVSPAYREKGVGAQMVNQLEQWARSMSCTSILMAALMNKDFPDVEKFYTTKGYKHLEVNFHKEL